MGWRINIEDSRYVPLTHKELLETLHYDPETGVFRWKSCHFKRLIGQVTGGARNGDGYLGVTIRRQSYKCHRLAWFYVTGAMPEVEIDHINGVRDDNRSSNLREATHAENRQNMKRAHRNNKTGFLGVSPKKGRFAATISHNKKLIRLGTFKTPEEAHECYLEAKRKLHSHQTIA